MNIESQVTSLELSKRLKELGIENDSLFYYCNIDGEGKYYIYYSEQMPEEFEYEGDPIAAFNVAELLSLLPNRITLPEGEPYNSFRFRMEKSLHVKGMDEPSTLIVSYLYIVNYVCDTISNETKWVFNQLTNNISDENPSNALALMLICLYENGLIKNDN